MMMGILMVCIACGHFVAGWLAKGAAFPQQITSAVEGRLIYLDFFTQIAIAPFVVALLIFVARGIIRSGQLKKNKVEVQENPL